MMEIHLQENPDIRDVFARQIPLPPADHDRQLIQGPGPGQDTRLGRLRGHEEVPGLLVLRSHTPEMRVHIHVQGSILLPAVPSRDLVP